jgi:ribonucleoside-diphosphate reductase alpha chain
MTYDGVVLPIKRTSDGVLEEKMTANAYHNILPARYLRKNQNDELVETQKELFERVAQNVALADAVLGPETPEDGINATPAHIKTTVSSQKRASLIEEVFGKGVTGDDDVEVVLSEANINKFSYETILPLLDGAHREYVEELAQNFYDFMTDLSFTPNSPTLMNAGLELQQLSACFVNSPDDDIYDIHETAREAAEVFQSGGGMGYAFWQIRPYGDSVGSTGGIASGPVTFMRTFDQMCETIAQGGKRRGAQMGVMKVDHPDVVEFIHAKNKDVSLAVSLRLNDPDDYTYTTFGEALEEARGLIDEDGKVPKHLRNAVEGHLSNFNVSVGVTNAFMDALNEDGEFTFMNPRTGEPHIATAETKEMYERYGLGEYVTVGEEFTMPAEVLWDRIIDGAHENGEPGIIYLERVNELHSFDTDTYPEHEILATNPCGEQPLEEYEACNLGHINLSTIVSQDAPDWRAWNEEHGDEYDSLDEAIKTYFDVAIDVDEFNERIDLGTHFLENVVTMSDFPIPEIEQKVREMRKIGLGIMGLAQMYIQLGFAYGDDDANEFVRHLMMHINHESKRVSHELALIRGSFSDWDESKYADPVEYREWFEHHVGQSADEWEDGFPIRNHNTTTIAPTGTTSMIGNTSGGCEPIFSVAYFKNVSDDVQGDDMLVEFDDYFLRVLEANDVDVEQAQKEAVELMNNNEFDGVSSIPSVPNAIGELFVVTADLSGIDHASVQCACQAGVDSAISKTCNFPNSATKEDMDEVYRYVYANGGKGVTVYRDGTRSKQVLTTRRDNTEFADEEEAAKFLVEQIHEVFGGMDGFLGSEEVQDVLGETLIVTDADEEPAPASEPVEAEDVPLSHAHKRSRPAMLTGVTQRIETGYGKMYVTINVDEHGEPFEMFVKIGNSGGFTESFTDALGKVLSTALRSGVDPTEIRDELKGIRSPKVAWDGGEQIRSIPDAVGKALERYLDGEVPSPTSPAPEPTPQTAQKKAASEGDATKQLVSEGENPECPDCDSMQLAMTEGCKTCQNCGWSEC